MRKIALLAALPLLLGSVALADEVVSFYDIPVQTAPGQVTYNVDLTGGYTMGMLDWNGFAAAIQQYTYGSELLLELSGPLGATQIELGYGSSYYPGAWFSGTSGFFNQAGDPAGTWTFDFWDDYDDGGDGLPDATWDEIHFTFNEYMPPPPPVYTFNLDTDPGWATEGQWAFGQPTGGGSHNYDPTSGYTGDNVYGYNLNGDYVNNMPRYNLTTGALDFSGYTDVQLEFQRWLGVESASWDHAGIEVSTDGQNWATVWEHTGSSISDSSWQLMNYDISDWADGESTVYVRWAMGTTDSSVTYPGWNIDDIVFRGIPEPASLLLLGLGAVLLRRR
jgi:hypothetical protein